jgi:hypothetical protein
MTIATDPNHAANTNAVFINNQGVRFFTQNADLLKRLADNGVGSVEISQKRPSNQYGHRFESLTPQQVTQHQDDFQKLVRESIRIVLDRQPVRR